MLCRLPLYRGQTTRQAFASLRLDLPSALAAYSETLCELRVCGAVGQALGEDRPLYAVGSKVHAIQRDAHLSRQLLARDDFISWFIVCRRCLQRSRLIWRVQR
jgi:hypothetical protein